MREMSKQELMFELEILTSNNPNNISFDIDDIEHIACDTSQIYTKEFHVSTSLATEFHTAVQPFNNEIKGVLCHFSITTNYDMSNVISIMDTLQQDLDDETDILFAISYIDDIRPSSMMMTVFISTLEKLVQVNNVYKR